MPISNLKNEKGNTTLHVAMVKGISTIAKGMPVSITLRDGYMEIQQRFSKNASIALRYSHILKIKEICKKELIVKKTSSVGSVVKSEELLGIRSWIPNSKGQGSGYKDYFVISYQSTPPKVIIFEKVIGTTIGAKEFIEEATQKAIVAKETL
jgi:hypothetical protein